MLLVTGAERVLALCKIELQAISFQWAKQMHQINCW